MKSKYLDLLEALGRHDVDYMVVGGVAAVLAGAPVTTLDLDILFSQTPENRDRILALLHEIDARNRDPAGRELRPSLERLESLRLHLLLTSLGPLDLQSEIGDAWGYEDLVASSTLRELRGFRVRVLDLDKLIEVKEITGRDKDLAMLPILRRTRDLQSS